jgi:hypothetical protein
MAHFAIKFVAERPIPTVLKQYKWAVRESRRGFPHAHPLLTAFEKLVV